MMRTDKLTAFALLLREHQIVDLAKRGVDCPANRADCFVTIKPRRKYTLVDVGRSGKYMIDADENIYGIKAYGVIHRGHQYGTLDTINEYYWGEYVAQKRRG